MCVLLALAAAMAAGEAAAQRPYICHARDHTIVVDRIASDAPRYRSWKRPRAITERPDLQLLTGEVRGEGTGPCSHWLYAFKSGPYAYEVYDGLGCFADDDVAEALTPAGKIEANGFLVVRRDDQEVLRSLCFTPQGLATVDARRAATRVRP